MTGLRQAMALLTRVPVGTVGGVDKAAGWFPLVGALVGLVLAASYAVAYPWAPTLLGAIAAVGLGVFVTGAFHEDGLADTFDALGSGATGDEALRIMRDSRLGTYGTLAVVFSVMWRVLAVASLTPAAAAASLVVSHTLGRTASVAMMAVTPAARVDGLGSSGVAGVSVQGTRAGVISGIGISLLAAGWWVIPALILTVAVVLMTRALAIRRIGGVTGDVLGACEQICEMVVLAVVASAAWRGWGPWWAG